MYQYNASPATHKRCPQLSTMFGLHNIYYRQSLQLPKIRESSILSVNCPVDGVSRPLSGSAQEFAHRQPPTRVAITRPTVAATHKNLAPAATVVRSLRSAPPRPHAKYTAPQTDKRMPRLPRSRSGRPRRRRTNRCRTACLVPRFLARSTTSRPRRTVALARLQSPHPAPANAQRTSYFARHWPSASATAHAIRADVAMREAGPFHLLLTIAEHRAPTNREAMRDHASWSRLSPGARPAEPPLPARTVTRPFP